MITGIELTLTEDPVDTTTMAKGGDEETPFWKQPAIWVTAALIPLVYAVVFIVLLRDGYTNDLRTMVVTAVVSGVLGAITGFWLAASWVTGKSKPAASTTITTTTPPGGDITATTSTGDTKT